MGNLFLFCHFAANPVAHVLPKPIATKVNDAAAPKRSLNLEDYKKKRGLI